MTDNNKPHTSSYKSKKSLDPIFEIKFKEEESSDTQAIFEVNIINEQIEIKDDPLPPCESEKRTSEDEASYEVDIIDEQIEIKDDPVPETQTEERNISPIKEVEGHNEVQIIEEENKTVDDPIPQFENVDIKMIIEDEETNEVCFPDKQTKTKEQLGNVDTKEVIEDEENNEIRIPDQIKSIDVPGPLFENVDIKPLGEDEESNDIHVADEQTEAGDVPAPQFENVDIKIEEGIIEMDIIDKQIEIKDDPIPELENKDEKITLDKEDEVNIEMHIIDEQIEIKDHPIPELDNKDEKISLVEEDEENYETHISDEQIEIVDHPIPELENKDEKITLDKEDEELHSAADKIQLVENGTACEDACITSRTLDSNPVRTVKTYSKHVPVEFWHKETQQNIFEDDPVVKYSYEEVTFKLVVIKKSKVHKVRNQHIKKPIVQQKNRSEPLSTKRKRTKKYSCKKCNRSFTFERTFNKHNQESSSCRGNIANCHICGKQLANKKSLNDHNKRCHKVSVGENNKRAKYRCIKKYLCEVCGLWYNRIKHHMLSHSKKIRVRKVVNKKRFECKICLKSYSNRGAFRIHENIHRGIKTYRCKFCDEAFFYRKTLINHESTFHTGDFPFACKICGSSFVSLCQLKSHEEIHSEVKNYQCDLCGMKFVTRRYLSFHKNNIHKLYLEKGSPRNTCKFCGKIVINFANLLKHENQHVVNDKYVCEICNKTFQSLKGLTCHIARNCKSRSQAKRRKKEKKPFSCKLCGKSFPLRYRLMHHLCVQSDDNPHICVICDKHFSSNCALHNHNLVCHCEDKQFQCNHCEKKFALKSILVNHMRIHTGYKPYECKCCGKRFIQKAHLKTHKLIKSGIRPFICDICGATFNLKPSLKDHILIHLR